MVTGRQVRNFFTYGALGGHVANRQHKKNARERSKRHGHKRATESFNRKEERDIKADRADWMKHNRKYYGSQKAANKAQDKFLKKYGAEKFTKHGTLNKEQKGLHKAINKGAQREFENRKPPSKLSDLRKQEGYKAGKKSILNELRNPSVKDIRKEKSFKAGEKSLLNQLKNPGVTDITKNPLYAQQGEYLRNLMSESPQAYENFKAPTMREFNEQIIPSINARYAGRQSGSQQREFAREATNLAEKLAAHRSNVQLQGLQNVIPHLQAPHQGEELRNRIHSQAQQNAGTYAQMPGENARLRAGVLNQAQQNMGNYETAAQNAEQQDIQNRFNYDEQGRAYAGLGLGTSPFSTHYRGATAPTPILTGGPSPVNRVRGNPPQPPAPSSPSFLQQLGGYVLPAAGAAAGTAIGGPIGGAIGGSIGGGMNQMFNTSDQQQPYQQPRAAGRGEEFRQQNTPPQFQPYQGGIRQSNFRGY